MSRPCKCSPPRVVVRKVPKGRSGTLTTAGMIAKMILAGAKDYRVRQKAIQIFRAYRVPGKDRVGEVCALFHWVRRNVRYTRDIFRVELLHTARRLLRLRAGDCDDMTILLGSMLLSTGHPVRLVLTGFQPERPHVYSHIYPEVHVDGKWIPVDTTLSTPIGTAPPARWTAICDFQKENMTCWSKTR